jgi:hypothetical protein
MVREPDATMQPTLQDNQLMSKQRVLSLKPQLRLEWRGQDGQNETKQPDLIKRSRGDSPPPPRRPRRPDCWTGAKASPINGLAADCYRDCYRLAGLSGVSTQRVETADLAYPGMGKATNGRVPTGSLPGRADPDLSHSGRRPSRSRRAPPRSTRPGAPSRSAPRASAGATDPARTRKTVSIKADEARPARADQLEVVPDNPLNLPKKSSATIRWRATDAISL